MKSKKKAVAKRGKKSIGHKRTRAQSGSSEAAKQQGQDTSAKPNQQGPTGTGSQEEPSVAEEYSSSCPAKGQSVCEFPFSEYLRSPLRLLVFASNDLRRDPV